MGNPHRRHLRNRRGKRYWFRRICTVGRRGSGNRCCRSGEAHRISKWRSKRDEMVGKGVATTNLFLTPGAANESEDQEGRPSGRRSTGSATRTYTTDKPFPWAKRSACHDSPASRETRSLIHASQQSTGRIWVNDRHISGKFVNSEGRCEGGAKIITHDFSFTVGVVVTMREEIERGKEKGD